MRRRAETGVEPPARLRSFDVKEWLPLVDPDDYDPDRYRSVVDGELRGKPSMTLEAWRHGQAREMWSHARLDWCRRYGWSGGLSVLDLLRQQARGRGDG